MIRRFEEIESTQEEMRRWAEHGGARHLDAVVTRRQISGKGRRGAEWESGRQNLLTSIFLQPRGLPLTWVPLWIGCAVHSAAIRLTGGVAGLAIKWPNDLCIRDEVLGDSKIGGILCETSSSGVIAGIGINLGSAPEIAGRRTGTLPGLLPDALAEGILGQLAEEPTVEVVRAHFEASSLFRPGESIVWRDAEGAREFEGTYCGLGESGELLARPAGAVEPVRLFSEEVRRIRRIP